MHRTLFTLAVCALLSSAAAAPSPNSDQPSKLQGLQAAAQVSRDTFGIAHIKAGNDHDLYFMQGYVHAQDRLFQMDYNRRQASGTLAELFGNGALAADVELRTIGIRRAAVRSMAVLSGRGARRGRGIHRGRQRLRREPETAAARVSGAGDHPVSAVDRARRGDGRQGDLVQPVLRPGRHRQHRCDADVLGRCSTLHSDRGTGLTLFSQDLWRSQPFYLASTVPDASVAMAARPRNVRPRLRPRAMRRPLPWAGATLTVCAT